MTQSLTHSLNYMDIIQS